MNNAAHVIANVHRGRPVAVIVGLLPATTNVLRTLVDEGRLAGPHTAFAVTGVLREGGRVAGVRLADGSAVSAPVVVNAAGPWSAGLNRLAGVDGGMAIVNRPARQEVAYVPGPRNMDFARDGLVESPPVVSGA